jgi:proteasome lid subunit RPN8/RPN11
LLLADQIKEAILVHASNCSPDECCGLLAMDSSESIRFAYPLTNINPSPVSYTVDPDEHFHAMRHAEAQGWEIAGVFHSHPSGPATPSVIDVTSALEPDWVYLVAASNEIRGFRIQGSQVTEVALSPKR